MILTAALLLAAQNDVTDDWVNRAAVRAQSTVSCQVGADCDDLRSRALQWVTRNSRHPVVRATDDLIVTRGPRFGRNRTAFAVVFSAPRDGRRDIRFRAWCGDRIACFPSNEEWRRRFIRAMRPGRLP